MNENKKLLDLEGLQRYDGKIKTYIDDATKVTSITDQEIGNLFDLSKISSFNSFDNFSVSFSSTKITASASRGMALFLAPPLISTKSKLILA